MTRQDEKEAALARLKALVVELDAEFNGQPLNMPTAEVVMARLREGLRGTVLEDAAMSVEVQPPVWRGGKLVRPGTLDIRLDEEREFTGRTEALAFGIKTEIEEIAAQALKLVGEVRWRSSEQAERAQSVMLGTLLIAFRVGILAAAEFPAADLAAAIDQAERSMMMEADDVEAARADGEEFIGLMLGTLRKAYLDGANREAQGG